MVEQMTGFFVSFLANPSLLGIGLAVAFGAIWLVGYWPPLFNRAWLWVVLVTSAILTWAAVAFVQIPLQTLSGQALNRFWSQQVLLQWLLLAAIPQILLSGLVQEGAKLVPVVFWWWRMGRSIDPKLGLAIGAVAGAGFGVLEAQWVHNTIFAAGWSWEAVQTGGLLALAGFWERFFAVGFHVASCALAGYGLARGYGWQFYLVASLLHGLLNYSIVPLQAGLMTSFQLEVFIAAVAVLVTGAVLWLRWRRPAVVAEAESELTV